MTHTVKGFGIVNKAEIDMLRRKKTKENLFLTNLNNTTWEINYQNHQLFCFLEVKGRVISILMQMILHQDEVLKFYINFNKDI